jgi:hypothetical protein
LTVNVTQDPTGLHSRYILVFEEAPALTNIRGLIEHCHDEELLAVVTFARDGSCEQIHLEQEADGTWIVAQSSDDGEVIEQIQFSDDGEVLHHKVFMEAFTSDAVPFFMAGFSAA